MPTEINGGTITNDRDETGVTDTDELSVNQRVIRVYDSATNTFHEEPIVETGQNPTLFPTLKTIKSEINSGTVFLPPGNIWVRNGETLTWDKPIDIIGAGKNATQIRAIDGHNSWSIEVTANDVHLEGFFLNGNGNALHGLRFTNAKTCSASRLGINQHRGRAFELTGASYYFHGEELHIDGNNTDGGEDSGMKLHHDGNNGPHISRFYNCEIYNTVGAAGVVVDEAGNTGFTNCTIENNDGAGMKAFSLNGLGLDTVRFEANNADPTIEPDNQRSSLVLGGAANMSSFFINSCTLSSRDENQHITLGVPTERVDAGAIIGNRFNRATDSGYDIAANEIDYGGVWIGPNSWFNTPVSDYPPALLHNGYGEESAAAESPDTTLWPTGSMVNFTDSGDGSGDGVYLIAPNNTVLGPLA